MGVFEDFSRFLETRLEEFLRKNPHLELQALEEQLREQESETLRLIASFRVREKQLKNDILTTAQEIQRWHIRIEKANTAKRFDLVKPAEEHEAKLLRQGNQLCGQMQGVQDRIQKTMELHQQIQSRRNDVKAKIAQAEASRQTQRQPTPGWEKTTASSDAAQSSSAYQTILDPLEESFQRWETEQELNAMKRKMGK